MEPEEVEFACADRFGRRVVCRRSTWREKILKDHGDLAGRTEDIVATIEAPEEYLVDRDHGDRRHFVRRVGQRSLFVVVEYPPTEGSSVGYVVTAFVRRYPRKGDTLVYKE